MSSSPFPLRLDDATVVDGGGRLAGATLRAAADAVAQSLADAGVGQGHVVGLALHAARALVPAVIAVWERGAVPLLLPPALGKAELHAVAQGVPPAVVLCESPDAGRLAEALGAVSTPLAIATLPPLGLLRPAAEPATVEGALLRLSSGSTGTPKVIRNDAASLAAEAAAIGQAYGLQVGDRIVVPVPLTHAYGFDSGVLAALASGATLDQRPARSPRRI